MSISDYTITELNLFNKGLNKLPDDIHKYINLIFLNCCNNPLIYNFKPTLENIKKYNASRIQ